MDARIVIVQESNCLHFFWAPVSQAIDIRLEVPDDLPRFRLPEGVQHRLQELLDRQDQGEPLSAEEHPRLKAW